MELLGEREERLEELEADLQDVKQLYRDQIEYMCEQVVALTPKNTPDISRENSILSRTPFGAAFPDLPDQLPVSTQHLTPSASSPTLRSLASSTAKPPVEI